MNLEQLEASLNLKKTKQKNSSMREESTVTDGWREVTHGEKRVEKKVN